MIEHRRPLRDARALCDEAVFCPTLWITTSLKRRNQKRRNQARTSCSLARPCRPGGGPVLILKHLQATDNTQLETNSTRMEMEPLAPGLGDDEPGPPGLDEPVAAAIEVSLMAPQTSDHHAQPTGYGTPAYSTAVSGHPYGSAGAYGAQPVHPEYQSYEQYYYPGYHAGAAGETGEKHTGSLQTAALFCWPTTISSGLLSFYLAAMLA